MNKTLITFFTILFCLTSSVGWSVTWDDIVWRGSLYYKKFSDVPFTGKVEGWKQGLMKNGKKEGSWISYYDNGQLQEKSNYKNGRPHGFAIGYYKNGTIHYETNWKNGQEHGDWRDNYEYGTIRRKGQYKFGKMEGYWEYYHKNGELNEKLNYQNGKLEGFQEYWNSNGARMSTTGMYKNGKKISD